MHVGRVTFANSKLRHLFARFTANRRIILYWILKKQGVRMWTGFSWLRIGANGEIL
jgi:hypothetical protein